MRIEDLRIERTAKGARVAAEVTWENYEHSPQSLTIEALDPFASEMEASPDAFLVALLPIAQWRGEERILIDGAICPRLRDGLGVAMAHFAILHARCRPLRIEPSQGFRPTFPRTEPRAASFMSGGVDALALLRANRLDYPKEHPAFIRDCFLLFGMNTFDFGASGEDPARRIAFEQHASRLEKLTRRVGASLIRITTNVRSFYPDWKSWLDVGFGAGTISTALCFSSRISSVEIGSAAIGIRIPPHGSHPWLDFHYSTDAVTVHHSQTSLDRVEKTRMVAEWPDGLSVLRSCYYRSIPAEGRINCGECEKCVRTMLALLALGKLEDATTFPVRDVTASMVDSLYMESDNDRVYLVQCRHALEPTGRRDLIEAIDRKLDAYRHHRRKREFLDRMRSFARGARASGLTTVSERSRQ